MKYHYYELCFYHYEDYEMADDNLAKSHVIKTEIVSVDADTAFAILSEGLDLEEDAIQELRANLTSVQEIPECDAEERFDVERLCIRKESCYGVYYSRAKTSEERIFEVQRVYEMNDICMSRLLLSYPEVTVCEAKELLVWSGANNISDNEVRVILAGAQKNRLYN